MKKCILAIIISIILGGFAQAQYMPAIPQATLLAAQEAIQKINKPASQVVRVGIGTTNFGTYQYKEII